MLVGYTSDYVGQLCRGKKIEAHLFGRNWYVPEKAILNHKEKYQFAPTNTRHKKVSVIKIPKEKNIIAPNTELQQILHKFTEPVPVQKVEVKDAPVVISKPVAEVKKVADPIASP